MALRKLQVCDTNVDKPLEGQPLYLAKIGQTLHLERLSGDPQLKARLRALGLVPGAKLQVLASTIGGPIVLALAEAHVVLGRGMSQYILIR